MHGASREGESQAKACLSTDSSLYQSNEHLTISEAKRRSRHRSGSQSRDSSYTWAGCAKLVGTGLRVALNIKVLEEPRIRYQKEEVKKLSWLTVRGK
tara:strand:- start:1674 stop:1964 length:291 start_codon:yes stop_codon:yes gene_type:complete